MIARVFAKMLARMLATMLVLMCCVAGTLGPALAQTPSRGELLYTTHCIGCHSAQLHWRDQRVATDWKSLKAQVQRWQATALLNWREDDVDQVARYLNDVIYRFPPVAASAAMKSTNPRSTSVATSLTRSD